jgi:hypothetical protein
MTRPQTLSTGLAVVLVSLLLRGSPWAVLLASFGIASIHLNISPLILVLAVTVLVVKGATERQWEWWKLGAAAGGWILGCACRPDALGAAKLEYAQIVMHAVARERGLPLVFGLEWLPLDPAREFSRYASFLAIWLGFALAFVIADFSRRRLPPERRSLLWASLLLGAVFLVLTFANTRRGMTLWSAFSVVFVAAAFDTLVVPRLRQPGGGRQLFRALALVVLAAVALRGATAVDESVLRQKWNAEPPDRARLPAEWLKQNTPPGTIVLNVNWWDFAAFFFWNTHNRYVGGLDPIFQYAYRQFWEGSLDRLDDYLQRADGFEVCAEDRGLVVYRLRPDS